MKRILNVSRARWIGCGCSLVVLSVLVGVHLRGLPALLRPDAEWQALTEEKVRLAPLTLDALQGLRAECAQAQHRGATLADPLPAGWQAEPLAVDSGGRVRIRYSHAGTGLGWADLLTFIGGLEEKGGILSLDIQSSGTKRKRAIARVEIVVPAAPETTRPKAGATFPGADAPDLPRKVGCVPSLRRPSAFTGWLRRPVPAPGAASAPFRPDPPGWAVVRSPFV